MRIAYVTADNCGSGHAVRGIALVQAAERAEVENPATSFHLRAFGPPVRPNGPLPDLTGYEASTDWRLRVLQWKPDLLIGDLRADMLETLRLQLGCEAWLLMRIWPRAWREPVGWRAFAIEPGVDPLMGIRESVPPIVGPWRFTPEDGAELPASYSTWWEAHRYGFADRVRWVPGGSPDCARRLEVGFRDVETDGADVLVNLALVRLTYPSSTAACPGPRRPTLRGGWTWCA